MFIYFLIGLLGLSAALTVLDVGKPRQPISAETAALQVIVNGLIIWGLVTTL